MESSAENYKEHYRQFAQSVAFATRTWHHHAHLNNRARADRKILAALDRAARYWLDQRYIAVHTTIVVLGTIFDKDGHAYGVDKTPEAARRAKQHFGKPELRKRKLEAVVGGEPEWIDEYVERAAELGDDDIKTLRAEVRKARKIWEERLSPLRNKVFAHNEILSDDERAQIYNAVKEADITEVLQILLNVSNALWEAEFNGRKPDFTSDYTQPIGCAREDVEKLIASLLAPQSHAAEAAIET